MKINGLNELGMIIEDNNRIEKAEKEIRKMRIKELMTSGIDKEMATVMIDSFIKCAL